MSIEEIIGLLKRLRLHVIKEEIEIHKQIKKLLDSEGIKYEYEYMLGRGNRIDFLLEGGIGIEVKKGRPNQTKVIKQLTRYLSFGEVNKMILVMEKTMPIPREINGKECRLISLNRLWF